MKSFFQYCDQKDTQIQESAATQIARTALGNVGMSPEQIESMTLLFEFIEMSVIANKAKVISHLRQIAGSDEELNVILDKLMEVSKNLSIVKTASTKASKKFDVPSPSDSISGEENIS